MEVSLKKIYTFLMMNEVQYNGGAQQNSEHEQREKDIPTLKETLNDELNQYEAIEDEVGALATLRNLFESNEAKQLWRAEFGSEPLSYFNSENFERLKNKPSGKRVFGLAMSALYLEVRPSVAKLYFDEFPEDLNVIKFLFEEQNGIPRTGLDHSLFNLTMPFLKTEERLSTARTQYDEIAARRELAPDFLLEEKNKRMTFPDWENQFGEASLGWSETLREAGELEMYGDHFLDPMQIFTDAFEKLPEEQKAKFLRLAIADIQFSLVFHETFNSAFTQERVGKHKERTFHGHQFYNSAHSMLFRTHQPVSVYERDQSYFEHEMKSTADTGGDMEEYPYHRILIALVERLGKHSIEQDENTDLLVDLWDKNRNPIFGKPVAEALSTQNARRAAGKLLELIRTDNGDKNALAAVLYRLELGKIGISEKGAVYMERLYDLGEFNNPGFFVERLTAFGDAGVFDEQKKLLGYFKLGDLASEEKEIRAEVLDVTKNLLFHLTGRETVEELEEREQMLYEFTAHYHEFFNKEWLVEAGIRFNNLSFGEQGWFMQYAKHQQWVNSQEKFERDKEFFQVYGETGIRCFLSLEQGMSGDRIVNIGLGMPHYIAERIFEKYSDIIDTTDRAGVYLTEYFPNMEGRSPGLTAYVKENMLRKAKDVLIFFANKVEKEGEIPDSKEVLKQLENVKEEAILFTGTFKAIRQELPHIGLNEMGMVDFAIEPAMNLADNKQAVEQMEKIYRENYKDYPEKFVHGLMEGFADALKNPESHFYVLRHKGDVVAFSRFDKVYGKEGEVDHLYFGSFNVDPSYQSAKLGEALIEQSLMEEGALGVPIEADCDPNNPITQKYIEKGFVAISFYHLEGVPSFHIKFDYDLNKHLKSKQTERNEIVQKSEVVAAGQDSVTKIYLKNDIPDFSPCNNGYALTRYFTENEKIYCVFEKILYQEELAKAA